MPSCQRAKTITAPLGERRVDPSKPNSDQGKAKPGARPGWLRRFSFDRYPIFRSEERNGAYYLRKEVIQPLLPERLPCYDFTPITAHTLVRCLPCGLAYALLVQATLMV